jgi:dipeptidyl aminopeptidase/acylaminoacyl peptidase
MHFPFTTHGWWRCLVPATAALALVATATAAEDKTKESKKQKTIIEEWLRLGPLSAPFPAFGNEGDAKPKAADLLKYHHIDRDRLWPAAGSMLNTVGREAVAWEHAQADTGGVHLPADTTAPSVVYLAGYVDVPRWIKLDLEVKASHAFELWVGGKSVTKRDKPGKGAKSGTAKLTEGKHLILAKTVFVPGDSLVDWTLGVGVSPAKDFEAVPVLSTGPGRTMTIRDVLDGPAIESVRISPDGKLVAMSMEERRPPDGDADRWVEIRQVGDGALVRTLRDVSGSSWRWAPTGRRLSYVTRDDDAGTLRVIDIDTGETQTIVEDVKDFSNYQWSPDVSFVVYSVRKKPEKNKTGVQRLRSVSDRRAGDRNRSSLHVASVPTGGNRRITAGKYSTFVYDIHPDGRTLLIGRSYEDLSDRPYSVDEMFLLDLDTDTTELLHKGSWLGGATWSPDGKQILVTAGASAFDGVGANVPDGAIANDYDTQAFLFDAKTKEVDPITKDFDPAVQSVFWPKPGRNIIIVAEEGEYIRLFRYDVRKRTFKRIDVDCDVIHRCVVARDKPTAVLIGSKANWPPRLYAVDLRSGRSRELLDPTADRFDDVTIGNVEDWNFTATSGKQIAGRIHLPPDFDPSKKWPCIVYYYGGTSPVVRSFGGRYPKNLWAAHGYVVYVLQPSGATGFGQEFSAMHVNDWGKTVAGEIIEGTEKFLAAHDYVDPERVGCIGASFGGFMTQLLVTKTDIYAAAVSHAGISMISSYWGEGYWGYGYNSVSAANSFPWNRPDIYIDQSPLFGVENVTTPLLLLHGASDTNVPPGESEQMYTALKLLGKEVEYIRVQGQNHWILDYKKRLAWNDAIVSWFDRWLKDQPQWWNDMYPPLNKEKEGDGKDKR